MEIDQEIPHFLTVAQFSQRHGWPIGGLRHLIFNEHTNGFARCVRRVGRKVLINEVEFFRWVESQNVSSSQGSSDKRRAK
jgi:hypothetical protein